MDRRALAQRIKAVSYLTGEFKLRSGATSSFYWDKYRFESDPELLKGIAGEMARLLPDDDSILAGLELGGVPLTTAISLQTGRRALYVRKQAKNYGTCNLVEGGFERGQRAVVVEDVVTSGGQVVESVGQMREAGLIVERVLCAIDREQGGRKNIEAAGCRLDAVFTLAELEELAG